MPKICCVASPMPTCVRGSAEPSVETMSSTRPASGVEPTSFGKETAKRSGLGVGSVRGAGEAALDPVAKRRRASGTSPGRVMDPPSERAEDYRAGRGVRRDRPRPSVLLFDAERECLPNGAVDGELDDVRSGRPALRRLRARKRAHELALRREGRLAFVDLGFRVEPLDLIRDPDRLQ